MFWVVMEHRSTWATETEAKRDVLPLPLVVLVKVTVSEYVFALRLLVLLFIDTVMLVLAPGARDPLVLERLTQLWPLEMV